MVPENEAQRRSYLINRYPCKALKIKVIPEIDPGFVDFFVFLYVFSLLTSLPYCLLLLHLSNQNAFNLLKSSETTLLIWYTGLCARCVLGNNLIDITILNLPKTQFLQINTNTIRTLHVGWSATYIQSLKQIFSEHSEVDLKLHWDRNQYQLSTTL